MDKATSEKQKMIWVASNKSKVDMLKQQLDESMDKAKKRMDEYNDLFNKVNEKKLTTNKQFFALVYIVFQHDYNNTRFFKNLVEMFYAIDVELEKILSQFDEDLQEIQEKTGTDISNVKTDLENVKEIVHKPIMNISNFIDEQQSVEARKKKMEDDILDWATRSH